VRRQGSKNLHDDPVILHHLTERGEVRRHATEARHIVLDGLTIVKRGEVKLLTQLLRRRLLHTVIADPHGHDRVLGLLGRLLGDRQYHLQWYRAVQCVKHHHLLLLIGGTILDDAPKSPRLQLHLHQERIIEVIVLVRAG
jgi:hypothetical protein